MKKTPKVQSSTRRAFLKKSTLGVVSAGLVGTDILRGAVKESSTKVSQTAPKADITIWSPVPDVCLVRPGRFHVRNKTSVSFFADKTAVVLFFPDTDLTDAGVVEIPMGETRSINIKPQSVPPGQEKYYRYVAFSKTFKKYGVGGSEPEMIVP